VPKFSYQQTCAALGRHPEPNEYHFAEVDPFDDNFFMKKMLEIAEEENEREASQ
jgi:hypothetical protein